MMIAILRHSFLPLSFFNVWIWCNINNNNWNVDFVLILIGNRRRSRITIARAWASIWGTRPVCADYFPNAGIQPLERRPLPWCLHPISKMQPPSAAAAAAAAAAATVAAAAAQVNIKLSSTQFYNFVGWFCAIGILLKSMKSCKLRTFETDCWCFRLTGRQAWKRTQNWKRSWLPRRRWR